MTDIDKRLAALEREIENIKRTQRRQNDIQRGIKRRLDEISAGQAAIGDKFTDGLIRSSDQFSKIVDMQREAAQATTDVSRAVQDLERRIWMLEFWRHELTNTNGGTPGVSELDQMGNNASMTVQALASYFDVAELDALIIDVFGVSAEPSDFGDRKRNKVQEMVRRAIRRGLFWKLVNTARQQRPHALLPMDTGPL